MRVSILTTGSELLIGRIIDTNSTWIENELTAYRINTVSKLSVPDNDQDILDALFFLSGRSDGIIITGGLGPTEDDRTRSCAARFCGKALVFDSALYEGISARYESYTGRKAPDSNKKQAYVIEGSIILNNPAGSAPGFFIKGKPWLAAFPGVPSELKAMWPFFMKQLTEVYEMKSGNVRKWVRLTGESESLVESSLAMHIPSGTAIGTIAGAGTLDIKLDFGQETGIDGNKADTVVKNALALLPHIGRRVYSYDINETLAASVLRRLSEQKEHLMTAESCTGGLIGAALTACPGSSSVYYGGITAYSNSLKTSLLSVPEFVINEHGAVSLDTASAMLAGLRRIIPGNTFHLVTVTGIAGPEGGTPEKPVGTVYIGYSAPDGFSAVRQCLFSGNRDAVRIRAMNAALDMIREYADFRDLSDENLIGHMKTVLL